MSRTLVIRGGTVVTAEGRQAADVLVRDERVAMIAANVPVSPGDDVLDAKACLVMPGLVDAHVHFALDTGIFQTDDDFGIGTRAAACGGVTTIVDFATQLAGETPVDAVARRRAEADPLVCIDYALHCMITDFPVDEGASYGPSLTPAPVLREGWGEGEGPVARTRAAEPSLADLVAAGVPSVKVYTTYRPNYYCDDAKLVRIMRAAAAARALVMVHAENDALVSEATEALVRRDRTALRYHGMARPPLAEVEAVHRCLFLAHETGASLFVVHCSTPGAVRLIHEAREAGQPAVAETCPQYLLFSETVYEGARPEWYIMQPPIRAEKLRAQLWDLVTAGEVDSIGTDHCDYRLAQKRATGAFTTTPGGVPGVETLLPLLYTFGVQANRITLERLVQVTATNPARIYGLYPRKGSLAVGADADIVVYDPSGRSTITASALHSVSGYTPYEGFEVQGRVKATISRGGVVYADGRFRGQPGHGQFVPGAPFDPAVIGAL